MVFWKSSQSLHEGQSVLFFNNVGRYVSLKDATFEVSNGVTENCSLSLCDHCTTQWMMLHCNSHLTGGQECVTVLQHIPVTSCMFTGHHLCEVGCILQWFKTPALRAYSIYTYVCMHDTCSCEV